MKEPLQQIDEMLTGTRLSRAEAESHLAELSNLGETNFYESSAVSLLDHTLRNDIDGLLAKQKPWEQAGDPWLRNDCSARYLHQLRDIRKVIAVEQPAIYAPGHGKDVSHIEAFYDARTIYNLEVGPEHVHLLRTMYPDEPQIQTALGLVKEYIPPEKVDILVLASPGFRLDGWNYPALLKEDAFVITNVMGLEQNPLLHYLGSHRSGRFMTDSPGDAGDRVVATEAELLDRSYPGSREASYASVLEVVYAVSGQSNSLLERYATLWQQAVEQEVARQRTFTLDPERIARIEALGMRYGKYEWTEADSEQVRKECHRRTIHLETDGQTFRLKPLPTVGARPHDLTVYHFKG
jgi:hypothetical protein